MTCSKAEKRRRRRRAGGSFGILKCFWPTVNDDENVSKFRKVGPAPAFIVEKGCGLLQEVASPPPPSPLLMPAKDSHVDKKGGQGLSAAIKALFSETSLGKKSRQSTCSRGSDASSRGKLSLTRLSERSDSMNGRGKMIDSSVSDSTLSLDSSCCSSLSSSSGSNESSQKPSRSSSLGSSRRQHSFNKKDRGNWSDDGLCVLIVTLLVVVLWGKICAIICTSTWLYIMNHNRSIRDPNTSNGCSVMDSAEHKKRIVLGGFLDRKRSKSLNTSRQLLI